MQKRFGANVMLRIILCLLLSMIFTASAIPVSVSAAVTGITTADVILRTKPSASSVPLATIRAEREITVLEDQGEWCKIKSGSLTGYIMKKYIKDIKGSPAAQSGSSAPASSSSSAGASSSALQLGSMGSEVQDLQKTLKALGFFNDEATGNFGTVTQAAVRAYQESRGLTADGIAGSATMRRLAQESSTAVSAQSAASSVGLLKKGDEGDAVKQVQQALKNLGHFASDVTGFFGVMTEQALIAYQKANGLVADGVAGAQTLNLLLTSTAASGGSAIVKLGDKGTQVSSLQTMLKNVGYYTGSVDGDFGADTQKALIAYQQANGLAADGIAGTQTLTLLSASGSGATVNAPIVTGSTVDTSNSGVSGGLGGGGGGSGSATASIYSGDIKLVDWWSGEIDSVYPRAAIATVLDVRTGITFKIYRYGGTNHLDFETATKEDTALFNQIAGGTYSWSARPVILIVNGVKYAAAMNTMPHGGEHLDDNGLDGQLCMHFLNSWTHGGQASNDDMQMQIMAAYNSGK